MQIECSNCGSKQRFKYSAANIDSLIAFGWNAYAKKLYCPKCAIDFAVCDPAASICHETTRCAIMREAERQGVI